MSSKFYYSLLKVLGSASLRKLRKLRFIVEHRETASSLLNFRLKTIRKHGKYPAKIASTSRTLFCGLSYSLWVYTRTYRTTLSICVRVKFTKNHRF